LSEQETLNTYTWFLIITLVIHKNRSKPEIVDHLTSRFTGTLKAWREKYLIEADRNSITYAVQQDVELEGNVIYDEEH
jgi:hypothetical protein